MKEASLGNTVFPVHPGFKFLLDSGPRDVTGVSVSRQTHGVLPTLESQCARPFDRRHCPCSKVVNTENSEQHAMTPSLKGKSASKPGQLVFISIFCLVS